MFSSRCNPSKWRPLTANAIWCSNLISSYRPLTSIDPIVPFYSTFVSFPVESPSAVRNLIEAATSTTMWQLQIEPGLCSWAWKLVQLEFNQSPCHSKSFGCGEDECVYSSTEDIFACWSSRCQKLYSDWLQIHWAMLTTHIQISCRLAVKFSQANSSVWVGRHLTRLCRLLNFCYQLRRLFICIHVVCADAHQVTIEHMCIMTTTHIQTKLNVTVWKDR